MSEHRPEILEIRQQTYEEDRPNVLKKTETKRYKEE